MNFDFIAQQLTDGVLERDFLLGDVPGLLWTPSSASAVSPVPLILLGHPGRMQPMRPRLAARARRAAADGYASATVELPWTGDRSPSLATERARADLRAALAAGRSVPPDVVDRLILPLVEASVPEWQAVMDAALALPASGTVGFGRTNASVVFAEDASLPLNDSSSPSSQSRYEFGLLSRYANALGWTPERCRDVLQ